MEEKTERWRQRLATFGKALVRMDEVVTLWHSRKLSDLERDGMIQRFEYTQELAWKLLKNYIEYQGEAQLGGSRDTIRQAFRLGLIENSEPWFDMLESRNLTSHVYDEETEMTVIERIVDTYYPILSLLHAEMLKRAT
nr:nucleotidyltransferase substrate binding protein [uncultured Prevotella sp.]